MSSSGWGKLDLANSAVIKTLQGIDEGATSIISTMNTLLSAVKDILDIVKNFIVDIPDVETAVLKAAIEVIRAILKDLIATSGCYYLGVPIQIVNLIPEQTIVFDPQPMGWASIPEMMAPPVGGGSGGNYGFMQAVVDSLNDREDTLRPQFDSDAFVAGLVVVAGSSSYLNMIPVIAKLVKLFSGDRNSGAGEGLLDFSFPRPKHLRAEIVPAAVGGLSRVANRVTGSSGEHPIGVHLTWDRDDRETVVQDFGSAVVVTIKKVDIFRSKYPILPSATYSQLRQDPDVDDLAVFDYDGWNNEFFDDSIELGAAYYYAVGYETESTEDNGPAIEYVSMFMPVTHIFLPTEFNTMPRKGVPPDWMLLPSPMSLIPGINDLIGRVNFFLDTLEKRLDDSSSKYKKYIEALEKEIEKYSALAKSFLSTIQELIDLLTFPPDVYLGSFAFAGKGGNGFLTTTLGQALTDTSDPNRPPFDQGDEVVTGFILYAGSETAGKLTAFQNTIALLFGSATETSEVAYKAAADSINYVIDAVSSEISILDNLNKSPTPIAAAAEPPKGIGPDLEHAVEQNDGKECKT